MSVLKEFFSWRGLDEFVHMVKRENCDLCRGYDDEAPLAHLACSVLSVVGLSIGLSVFNSEGLKGSFY